MQYCNGVRMSWAVRRPRTKPRAAAPPARPGMQLMEERRLFASVLLNEIKVDPPGVHSPYEYVELRGQPGAGLDSIYFLSVEGDGDAPPVGAGRLDMVVDLTGRSLGPNGLLVITGTIPSHAFPADTTVVTEPQLDVGATALENGTNSFLLVRSPSKIEEGHDRDLDPEDDGTLDLPPGATVLDALGWSDGGAGDLVYGGVVLTQSADAPPDAATRFPGDDTPSSAGAWYNAELTGGPETVTYDASRCGVNFPTGGALSPGAANVPLVVPPPPRLNEVVVNPPGADDGFEYVEIEGAPGQVLARLFLVALEGDITATPGGPGRADMVVNFGGRALGANGLLVVKGAVGGHALPPGTAALVDAQFDLAGGGLENGTCSFLLVSSLSGVVEGADYDVNDDGVLELPPGAIVLDAVGWSDGGPADVVYGGVRLAPAGGGAAHAASRLPREDAPDGAAQWFGGGLQGTASSGLYYDPAHVTSNAPAGARLTPGAANFPPRVREFLLAGGSWAPSFVAALAASDLGDGGFRLPTGGEAEPVIVPWNNVNQIKARFSGGDIPQRDDLQVRGALLPRYEFANFAYDPESRTATWTLTAPVGHDYLELQLGGLLARARVAPGDVRRDGPPHAADWAEVRARLGRTASDSQGGGGPRYSVFSDVDGSGAIGVVDLLSVRRGLNLRASVLLARATHLLWD